MSKSIIDGLGSNCVWLLFILLNVVFILNYICRFGLVLSLNFLLKSINSLHLDFNTKESNIQK